MPLRKTSEKWLCEALGWKVGRFWKSWEGWKPETLEANLPTDV
jgi:hypothetical protein